MAVWLGSCGSASYSRPDLPKSVTPGWSMTWLDRVSPPADLPSGSNPRCWKAVYSGPGSVQFWVCTYSSETGAFDAAQRTRQDADMVRFQEGRRLVIARYRDTKPADLHSLIQTIQKRLG